MVATTQVQVLVGANYGVEVKKPSLVKPGFGGFLSREKVSS
jgi:hypothetical protein